MTSRLTHPATRVGATALVLVLLGRHLGAEPFRHGLASVTLPALVVAFVLTAATTACSAWRWYVVALALDVPIRPGAAVAAYYRSQLVNSVLPGGIVGDVHRGVTHGGPRGLQAVAWERAAGQAVQLAVTGVVLLAVPSPLPREVVVAAGLAALLVAGILLRRSAALADDLHRLAPVWRTLTLTSLVVVAGHTAVFVTAARVAGCGAPTGAVLGLAVLVQTATAVPLNVGGWGPREGAAAWAFGAAGLGAGMGLAVTTVYAVLALAALAPGAILLLIRRTGSDATGRHSDVCEITSSRPGSVPMVSPWAQG